MWHVSLFASTYLLFSSVIEMLLHHGAKTFVTENELEQLKNDTAPDTALPLLALKAQMNGPYKTLQPTYV